jgi:YebC/PmpR family DNA-binding regulatory protein
MDANASLRTMFQKARDSSVPLDTIERAIKRGTGELEGVNYESITYEGYAPHGVALYVETLSDNRNRTGSEVRSLLTKNGGSLAEPGSVAWQFERKGVIMLPGTTDEDEIMMVTLDAGAEDLVDDGGLWRLTCEPTDLPEVRQALEEASVAFDSADVTMLPTSTVGIESEAEARSVLRVIDLLDDLDDVQDVYANFSIPDEIFDALAE